MSDSIAEGPISVLLACDSRCVRGAAAAIRSVLDATEPATRVDFYVILDNVSRAQRESLFGTITSSVPAATIREVEVDLDRVSHLTTSKLVNRTAYARIFLGEALPRHVERCIYLDADLVMRRDIRELWATDLAGKLIGAVPNTTRADAESYRKRLGLDDARYFNSGVLLVDVKRWRAEGVGLRAIAFAERMRDLLILHDQDALNAVLHHDWKPLDWHWNVWTVDPRLKAADSAVFHYMGAPKPWDADYDLRFAAHFFAALDRTPFCGWRPWNPLHLGATLKRARRRLPYLPGLVRMIRARLSPRAS